MITRWQLFFILNTTNYENFEINQKIASVPKSHNCSTLINCTESSTIFFHKFSSTSIKDGTSTTTCELQWNMEIGQIREFRRIPKSGSKCYITLYIGFTQKYICYITGLGIHGKKSSGTCQCNTRNYSCMYN